MLNVTDHQGDTNQNHNNVSYFISDGHYQKTPKANQCGEIGRVAHC